MNRIALSPLRHVPRVSTGAPQALPRFGAPEKTSSHKPTPVASLEKLIGKLQALKLRLPLEVAIQDWMMQCLANLNRLLKGIKQPKFSPLRFFKNSFSDKGLRDKNLNIELMQLQFRAAELLINHSLASSGTPNKKRGAMEQRTRQSLETIHKRMIAIWGELHPLTHTEAQEKVKVLVKIYEEQALPLFDQNPAEALDLMVNALRQM